MTQRPRRLPLLRPSTSPTAIGRPSMFWAHVLPITIALIAIVLSLLLIARMTQHRMTAAAGSPAIPMLQRTIDLPGIVPGRDLVYFLPDDRDVMPAQDAADKAAALLDDEHVPTPEAVTVDALPAASAIEAQLAMQAGDETTAVSVEVIELPVPADAPTTATFLGRPLVATKSLRMVVTAYTPDARSCGTFADGITASGHSVFYNQMKSVAADTRVLPFGTLVSVPGYHDGEPVPVLDVGAAIKGQRLDVLMLDHNQARRWGRQTLDVIVWEFAGE